MSSATLLLPLKSIHFNLSQDRKKVRLSKADGNKTQDNYNVEFNHSSTGNKF